MIRVVPMRLGLDASGSQDRARVRVPPPLLFLGCALAAGFLEYLVPVPLVDYAIAAALVPALLVFGASGYARPRVGTADGRQ